MLDWIRSGSLIHFVVWMALAVPVLIGLSFTLRNLRIVTNKGPADKMAVLIFNKKGNGNLKRIVFRGRSLILLEFDKVDRADSYQVRLKGSASHDLRPYRFDYEAVLHFPRGVFSYAESYGAYWRTQLRSEVEKALETSLAKLPTMPNTEKELDSLAAQTADQLSEYTARRSFGIDLRSLELAFQARSQWSPGLRSLNTGDEPATQGETA